LDAFDETFMLGSIGTAEIVPVAGDVGVLGVLTTRRLDTGTGGVGTSDVNLHFRGNDAETNNDGGLIRLRGF
jgi:hypothetical protein